MDADSVKLDFDTTDTVRGVRKAVDSLDDLVEGLLRLDAASFKMANSASRNMEKLNQAAARLGSTNFKRFVSGYQEALQAMADGDGNPAGVNFVAKQNQALQVLYETRLANVVRMTNAELRVWEAYGASLGRLQKAQLKGYDLAGLQNLADSGAGNLAIAVQASAGNAGAVAQAKEAEFRREATTAAVARSTAYREALRKEAEEFERSPETLANMRKFYLLQDSIQNNANALTRKQAQEAFQLRSQVFKEELAKAAQALTSSPETLNSMRQFYMLRESIDSNQAATARRQAQEAFEARSRIHKEELAKAAESFAKSPSTLANMRKFYGLQESIDSNTLATFRRQAQEDFAARSAAYKAEQQKLRGDNSAAMALLREQYTTVGGNAYMETLRPAVAETTKMSQATRTLSSDFGVLRVSGNDVHSMLRGLASGFNLLWLTWGNLGPLFVGAAISNGFMQTAKTGMQVADTLNVIQHVGGNTVTEMEMLRGKLVELGSSGPFAPLEIANAMQVLSLAGLKADEIMSGLGTTLNFSLAGTTDMKTAAETLVSVSTAFGLGTAGFSRVSDVISKAAAESMTSVEAFGNAMKTASVAGAQYGATLEDVSVGVMALSNLGIQATSAGTALRNAYADLSGRSMQVAKVLRQQGIEVRDSVTGNFKPLIEVIGDLNTRFSQLTAIGQKNLLQALLSERGGKAVVELLRMIRTEAKDTGAGLSNALEEAIAKTRDAAGFSARVAAERAQSTLNQFKEVGAVMKTTMFSAYSDMEPALQGIARALKEAFGSPELLTVLSGMVNGIATLFLTITRNADGLLTAAKVFIGWKVALAASIPILTLVAQRTGASAAATAVDTAAKAANAGASTVAMRASTLLTASLTGQAAAWGVLARAIPFVGWAITGATAAWVAYEWYATKASTTAAKAHADSTADIISRLDKESEELERVNSLRRQGLTLLEAEARLKGEKEAKTAAGVEATLVSDFNKAWKAYQEAERLGRPLVTAAAKKSADNALMALQNFRGTEELKRQAEERHRKAYAESEQFGKSEQAARMKEMLKFNGLEDYQLGSGGAGGRVQTSKGDELTTLLGNLNESNEALATRQRLLTAGLPAEDKFLQLEDAKSKALADLNERHKEALENGRQRDAAASSRLALEYEQAKARITENHTLEVKNWLLEQETAATKALTEARAKFQNDYYKYVETNQKDIDAGKERLKLLEKQLEVSKTTLGVDPADQALTASMDAITKSYAAKKRERYTAFFDFWGSQESASVGEFYAALAQHDKENQILTEDEAREKGLVSALAYQEAWNSAIKNISSSFVDQLMDGTLDLKEFMIDTFANMVLKPQLNLTVQKGLDFAFSALAGWVTGVPSFDGGGHTGYGPRTGGLDGKGGKLALVHPDETVIDHTKGQSYGGGGPVYITIQQTVGDVATKQMLADSQAATVKQVEAGVHRAMRYRGAYANG